MNIPTLGKLVIEGHIVETFFKIGGATHAYWYETLQSEALFIGWFTLCQLVKMACYNLLSDGNRYLYGLMQARLQAKIRYLYTRLDKYLNIYCGDDERSHTSTGNIFKMLYWYNKKTLDW